VARGNGSHSLKQGWGDGLNKKKTSEKKGKLWAREDLNHGLRAKLFSLKPERETEKSKTRDKEKCVRRIGFLSKKERNPRKTREKAGCTVCSVSKKKRLRACFLKIREDIERSKE